MKRILFFTLAAVACSKASLPVRDAGVERSSFDTATPQGDASVPLAVDFAIESCASFDAQALTCTGKVPLTVRFVPLATTTVTQYYWDFGDGTAYSGESAPPHVYTVPGVYSVTVVARGDNGDLKNKTHTGFIVAQANPIGDPCDSDVQCNEGLFCLCPTSAPCIPGPAHGLCASSCAVGACGDAEVCARLLTATPPAGKASAWQGPLCLRGCMKDEDCADGLSCRTLPQGLSGDTWVQGCFASVPGDIGSSCVDDGGNLRNDLCTSGLCADLGANGLCTVNCAVSDCPTGSDCAVFGDGRELCLRSCSGFNCSQDPLLTCVVPGRGALGYQLLSPTSTSATSTYCAPNPCLPDDLDDKCMPTGTCVYDASLSHCVKRSP